MTEPAELSPASILAIAEKVVELLKAEPSSTPGRYLTAAEVADRFAVSRDWVYAHAEELGAERLTDGPRARLRFDPARVVDALAKPFTTPPTRSAPPKRRTTTSTADLLPIKGER